jgi:hypothetical protein
MTWEDKLYFTKNEFVTEPIIITSLDAAENFHKQLIQLRCKLIERGLIDIMPHYRGEQKYGWDIKPGIFRPPLENLKNEDGKKLEKQAIQEFEKVITQQLGKNTLRNIFNNETFGKEWDLLFQAQHAGIRTTLTDWSAEIISALYFATEESSNSDIESEDAQLWALLVPINRIISHTTSGASNSLYEINPFDTAESYLINPSSFLDEIDTRIFEYRMYRQKGRFLMPPATTCKTPVNKQPEF